MKKIFLIIVCSIVVVSSMSQEMQNKNADSKRHELQNTRWLSKIDDFCSNFYEFKEHGSYIYYSGERDE